ncbi:MAG: type I methionyl aminopeptidase [Patescibacteria group bacterium]|nr:type I methionyl aminopeptidase [Patescibacteria group bacterium]
MVQDCGRLPTLRYKWRALYRSYPCRYSREIKFVILQSEKDTKMLRTAGKILAEVLRETAERCGPGVSAEVLNAFAEAQIRARGAEPAFLGYTPEGASAPYPATLCVSVNDEVVHSLPTKEKIFKKGDVVSLDLGLIYEGFVVDSARTELVGADDADAKRLIKATREALDAAIATARAGVHTGDIGAAVSRVAKDYHLSVVRDLGGHGTGRAVHESPFVPNFGTQGGGELLVEGMVLAFEPIFTLGKGAIELDPDQWTYRTKDASRSAHFEHTVLIGKEGAEIITR